MGRLPPQPSDNLDPGGGVHPGTRGPPPEGKQRKVAILQSVHHDDGMTAYEYATLSWSQVRNDCHWFGPDGKDSTMSKKWIVVLNEIGQKGWEAIGYIVSDSRFYCLLKRPLGERGA